MTIKLSALLLGMMVSLMHLMARTRILQ